MLMLYNVICTFGIIKHLRNYPYLSLTSVLQFNWSDNEINRWGKETELHSPWHKPEYCIIIKTIILKVVINHCNFIHIY